MIYSRYLVSDSHRVSRSPFRWLSDLARRAFPFSPTGQEPFTRLKFWTVRHPLIDRLERYEASEVPSMFRAASWNTLLFWSMLLDGDDEGIARLAGIDPDSPIPDPDVWFGRVKDSMSSLYNERI